MELQSVKKNKLNISVTCSNYKFFLKLVDLGVQEIIIGIKNFSCRFNNYFLLEDIISLIKNKKQSKISICLNNIYFEDQIGDLEKLIIELSKLNIDKIIFHDFSVLEIIWEQKINIDVHYNPETLVTSYGQLDFYNKNNIQSLTLATELTNNEIKKIAIENKNNMNLYIKIHGLGFIMHSRWPMISNFYSNLNLKIEKGKNFDYLLIRESEREMSNIIFEDNVGTHMMTGYYICGIKKILHLNRMGINNFLIDDLFIEEKNIIEIIKLYLKIISSKKKDNKFIDEEGSLFFEKIKKISSLQISENFFNFPNGLMHMLKKGSTQ